MHTKYLYCLLLVCVISCKPVQQDEVTIENLMTVADCVGPAGSYTTTIHAHVDGYTLFHQVYSYRKHTYTNISFTDSTGYVLQNDSLVRQIDRQEVFFGKGHSFHFIAAFPEKYFSQDEKGNWRDLLGNPTLIEFDSLTNRLVSFEFINPFDTAQSIKTVYSNWQDYDGFQLAKNVLITQADTLEFSFDYSSILVNTDKFEKRQLVPN